MEFVEIEDEEEYMAYNQVDAQRARRIMTLDRHLMRLGLVGSLKDHMMEQRARLLKQLPLGFNLGRFARLERKMMRVSASEKGIVDNVKEVFHPGGDDDNSGWYWRMHPKVMRKRAAELEIEHDRWLPPERQKELQAEREVKRLLALEAEREAKRQKELQAEREASKW
jgi:hypothetical protein